MSRLRLGKAVGVVIPWKEVFVDGRWRSSCWMISGLEVYESLKNIVCLG